MKYKYSAIDDKGKAVEGEMVAQTTEEVEAVLREDRLSVVNVSSIVEKGEGGVGDDKVFKAKIAEDDKIQFLSNLGTMLKAGLPVTDALEILMDAAKEKGMKQILEIALYDIREGSTFSGSLSKFPEAFTVMDLSMFEVGEAGGALEANIRNLADQLQKQKDLKSKVRGAMMYPAVISIALVAIMILMIVFVIPQMTTFFEDADLELPFMTRALMATSDFLIKYGVFLLIGLVIGVMSFGRVNRTNKAFKRKVDHAILRIPFAGKLIQKIYISQYCRAMASLMKSGVPILESLEIVEKSFSNLIMVDSVANIRDEVERGVDLADAMDKQGEVFFPMVNRLVKVGTRTGTVDESLRNLAEYYDTEVTDLLDNLSTIIEPILLLTMGVGVAIIALSVLSPIYQLVGNIDTTA